MGASVATKNAMLEVVRAKTLYFGLIIGDPAVSGNEVPAASYVRQATTFSAPVDGAMGNSAIVEFPQALENWGTVSHWGLFDGSGAAAAILWTGAFSAARQILMGDVMMLRAGGVTVEIRECQS